jgi:hydrogenase nickel incorporation protein HypA/HybF
VAASSRLEVETVPIRVRCSACEAESAAEPNRLVCPRCGDTHTRLASGDELLLTGVELVF